jgi:hypothetical protein
MFDTVVLNHAYMHAPPREVLEGFRWVGDRYVHNAPPVKNYARPQLTWSAAPDGINYLTARVSVPKMIYSNNVQMITGADISLALDTITGYASDVSGVAFDAATANIVSLDVCHNYQVGEEEVFGYLNALRVAI